MRSPGHPGRRFKQFGLPAPRWRLRVEQLEDRAVPAVTFTAAATPVAPLVNTLDQALGGISGFVPIEPALSVNPTDPTNVVVSSHNGLRVSTNAGATFAGSVTFAAPPGSNSSAGDTDTAFDDQGRLYWANLAGAGTTGVAIDRINPLTGATITTARASNNGDDKERLAVDTNPASPFYGNVYVTWTTFGFNPPEVMFSRSTDHGQTWSAPLQLSTPTESFSWPVNLAVAPNGDVYVAYHSQPGFSGNNPDGSSGKIVVVRSADGGQTFPQKTNAFDPGQADVTFNVQTAPAVGTIPQTQFWTQGSGEPYVMADPVRPHRLYVVAADDPDNNHGSGDASDVVFATSADDGQTWTRTTLESGPSNSFQLFPTAAIDQFGDIAVAWYDNRRGLLNGNGRYELDVFAKYSPDGGQTWSPAFQVNDPADPFDPDNGAFNRFSGPPPTTRIGEYFGLDLYGDTVHVAWNGSTTGHKVVYDSFPLAGALNVLGDDAGPAADNIVLRRLAANPNYVQVMVNGVQQYAGLYSGLTGISVNGGQLGDTLTIDYTNGDPVPAGGLTSNLVESILVTGGPTADSLRLSRTGPGAFRFVRGTGGNVDFAGATAFRFDGSGGADTLTVDDSGGVVNLPIIFNAGNQAGDTFAVTGDPGAAVARETYLVGPTRDSGTWVLDPDGNRGAGLPNGGNGDEMTVAFTGVTAANTDTPASVFDAVLTAGADAFTVQNSATLNGSASLLVADGGATFAPFQFARKTNPRLMGRGGADTATLNYTAASAGLAALEVHGDVAPDVAGMPADDSAADVFAVRATAAGPALGLFGEGGDDVFRHAAAEGANLDGVQGTVFVLGGPGNDSLTLSDASATAADAVTVTNSQLAGLAPAAINYSTVESVSVTATGLGDTVAVQSTAAGTAYTLNGGAGNDTFTVADAANSLAGVLGALAIDAGTGTANRLVVTDAAGAGHVVTVTATQVTGLAPVPISYAATGGSFSGAANDGVLLHGSDTAADTFNVRGTLAGSTTRVEGGGGNDTVNVSSDAGTNAGDLLGVQGILTVDGGAGVNRLVVSNFGGAAGVNAVVTQSQIVGLAPAVINYAATGGSFNGAANDGVLVRGSNSGADTFNVRGTLAGSATRIEGNGGDDTVNVSSNAAANTGDLTGLLGTLTVDGGAGGSDRLAVSNAGGLGTPNALVTATQLAGLAPAVINYAALESVSVTASGQADGVTVQSTAAGTSYTLNGGAGDDTFTVADAANSLAGILGAVSIDAGGGSGNRLVVSDAAGTGHVNVTVTPALIAGLAAVPIGYAATGGAFNPLAGPGVLVRGSNSGADVFNVRGTLAGSSTRIEGGGGNDGFNLGDVANTLAGVQGILTVDGGAGVNRLVVNNLGGLATPTAVVTASQLTGLAPAAINYQATGGNFDGANGDGVLIRGSDTGADTFTIRGTLAGSTTRVEGNGGSDTFNVGDAAGTLDGTLGALTVDGGGNGSTTSGLSVTADGVTVTSNLPTSDALNVNDQGHAAAGETYTLTPTTTQRGSGPSITYAAVETVGLNIGGGGDTVTVSGTAASSTTRVTGGAGDDTIILAAVGTAGNVVLDGGDGADAITVAGTAAGGVVQLLGGDGADRLTLQGAAAGSGALLDGGAGDDDLRAAAGDAGSAVRIAGGDGDDAVTLGAAGELEDLLGAAEASGDAGTDTLTLDDSADADGHTYTVAAGHTARVGGPAVAFDATTEKLVVDSGTAADTFAVTPDAATAVTVNAGDPPPPASPGDLLALDLTGATGTALTPAGVGAGQFTFTNRAAVAFAGIESLTPGVPVGGTVFNDLDGNGKPDTGEGGLAGATVQLDIGADGTEDRTTTTDAGGAFNFADLSPGTYRVRLLVPDGSIATTAAPADLTATSAGAGDLSFGVFKLVTISGTVFDDLDGSGSRNGSEPVQAGVTVTLTDAATGTALATATTDASGAYSFPGRGPGTYRVQVTVPGGFTQTTAAPADIKAHSGSDATADFGLRQIVAPPPPASPPPPVSPPPPPPGVGPATDGTITPPVVTVPPPGSTPPPAPPLNQLGIPGLAVGADAGGAPIVRFFNPDGSERFAQMPFGSDFTGGVRTAAADFNGDGVADFVVATGPGVQTEVLVLDGKTGVVSYDLGPFEPAFTGGVFVAAADVDGDGKADLIVTPDTGGGPRVRVFSGDGFRVLADFFGIGDPDFRGGARAALGDVNHDGTPDLVVAAGFGGGPRVAVWDGASLREGVTPRKLVEDFFVFQPELRNGVYVSAGDLNGDGSADVLFGAGPDGGPRVMALSGADLVAGRQTPLADFFAGDVTNRGGIRVAAKDLDGDRFADIVVGSGSGAGTRVTAYAGKDVPVVGAPPELRDFDAFPGFDGGVFVG